MASALAEAHIEIQRRLRALTTGAVEAVWRDLPAYNRENVDEWLTRVLPIAGAAQRQSVALTEAYLARALERQPFGTPPAEIADAVRPGVSPEEVYERPFVTLWTKLGSGVLFPAANAAALARATSTAAMDVQMAMRATAGAVQSQDGAIYGYERVADGAACEFCSEIDGAFVKSADASPLHPHCGCGLEPVTQPRRRATPLPSTVAVHEHGELGAVLAAPGHDFTQL